MTREPWIPKPFYQSSLLCPACREYKRDGLLRSVAAYNDDELCETHLAQKHGVFVEMMEWVQFHGRKGKSPLDWTQDEMILHAKHCKAGETGECPCWPKYSKHPTLPGELIPGIPGSKKGKR